jgi:putative colanic acid biosynthesis acetyltransferase WcaF
MSTREGIARVWQHGGVVFFNAVGTHLPTHALRCALLRAWGARIGTGTAIGTGTTVLGIEHLEIGSRTRIGWRCLLDARGGLAIGDDVEISDDVQFITAHHEPQSSDFHAITAAISVGDHTWIASRATVLDGVTVGVGAVIGACALVSRSVCSRTVAVGIPARAVGSRDASLAYLVDARGARA